MSAPAAPTDVREQALALGLLPEEYDAIVDFLGRDPNPTEVAVYAVMWSEHCSYKNSILQLKKLPKDGPAVLAAAGEENAGLLDLGDGWAVSFKVESHNHPSAVEPYQGAATGVGGIHRDILTMGARPIAALNSLRFGDPSTARTRRLVAGVVRGIGDYGNAFGVPTVGGEVFFDPAYETNPLVNAMSVGVVRIGQTVSAIAEGPGNPVYIVGSATGRDGIHGATFASADLGADSAEKLPAVQIGDPFQEKLLLEATQELVGTGAVVGMQDMGAAGIACSTSEMSAKGGVGMDVHLDRVPLRHRTMDPAEIVISESQERMLVVVHAGREAEVEAIFAKWDLPCQRIGTVTEGNTLRYLWDGQEVSRMPAASLVLGGGAPRYVRDQREPAYLAQCRAFDPNAYPVPPTLAPALNQLLDLPTLTSKRWITRQYDRMVGAATLSANQPMAAAVVQINGTNKALSLSLDCNPRHVYLDPERGAALAVAEAARNVACTGARPLGITNCLNFGNPHDPEVYWQFAHAIDGMTAACNAFGLPVTGGNVSLYNGSEQGPVYPTPTIGLVGLIDDVAAHAPMRMDFRQPGDAIYLLGTMDATLGGSTYLHHVLGVRHSPAPLVDLEQERLLQLGLPALVRARAIRSAQDVSEGGLLLSLLECAFPNGLGFDVKRPQDAPRADAFWFGEDGGRVVISVSSEHAAGFMARLDALGLRAWRLGWVTDEPVVRVDGEDLGPLEQLQQRYNTALERALDVTY